MKMNDDYIIIQLFQDTQNCFRASLGMDTVVDVSSELINGLAPNKKNEAIQFSRLLLDEAPDEFDSLFEDYNKNSNSNTNKTPVAVKNSLKGCNVNDILHVRIIWVENERVTVRFEDDVCFIPRELMPNIIFNNAFSLKVVQSLPIDALVIMYAGQKVLSIKDDVIRCFNRLTIDETEPGLRDVEVVMCNKRLDGESAYLLCRWKGIYGGLLVKNTDLNVLGLEKWPEPGNNVKLWISHFFGNNCKEMALSLPNYKSEIGHMLKAQKITKLFCHIGGFNVRILKESISENVAKALKEGKECSLDLQLVAYSKSNVKFYAAGNGFIGDPSIIHGSCEVNLINIITPNTWLVKFNDKFYLMYSPIVDKELANIIKNRLLAMEQYGSLGASFKGLKRGSLNFLEWDCIIGSHNLLDVSNSKPFEVEVLSVVDEKVFFMVGDMLGYVERNECPVDFHIGDVINVMYESAFNNNFQLIRCKCLSLCKQKSYLPIIEPEILENDGVSLEGFVVMGKIINSDDNGISVIVGNRQYIMDSEEFGYLPNYRIQATGFVNIDMPFAIMANGQVSRKMFIERQEYQTSWEGLVESSIEWDGWMDWRLWRRYTDHSTFRNGNRFIAVRNDLLEKSLCTRDPLKIGSIVQLSHKDEIINIKPIDYGVFEQSRPHCGDLVSARIYRKNENDVWLLGGDNWIGQLIKEEPLPNKLIDSSSTLICRVVDFNNETHELLCSYVKAINYFKIDDILDVKVLDTTNDLIRVGFSYVSIVVSALSTTWKQKALVCACRDGKNVKLRIKDINFETCELSTQIIGINGKLFSEAVPDTGIKFEATVVSIFDEGYLLKTDIGYGLLPLSEGLQNRDPYTEFVISEKIDVVVIGFDSESSMPILSYKKINVNTQFTDYTIGNVYEARAIKSSIYGVLVKILSPSTRIFLSLRYVYTWEKDYIHKRIVQNQRLKLTYLGHGKFITHLIQTDLSRPKEERARLKVFSITNLGMNLWNEDGRLVWVSSNDIGYKKNMNPMNLGLQKGDLVYGFYKNIQTTTFLFATFKAGPNVYDTYPIGTKMTGNVVSYNDKKQIYHLDLGVALGVMTIYDSSWVPKDRHLSIGQKVNVIVSRQLGELNLLGVTMLTTEPWGQDITAWRLAEVISIDNHWIKVMIDEICAYANISNAQQVFGIDNFGKVKLKIGSLVKARQKSVDLIRRRIYVELIKL